MKKFTWWLVSFFGFFLILSFLAAFFEWYGFSFAISSVSPLYSIFTSQIFHSSCNEFLANAFVLCILFGVFFYFRDILSKIFHSFHQFLAVFALPFLLAGLALWGWFHLKSSGEIVGMSILNFSLIGLFLAFSIFYMCNKLEPKVIFPIFSVLFVYVVYSLWMPPNIVTFWAHFLGLFFGFICGFVYIKSSSR
jgi:membrane associated rhomboid family serine protease